MIFLVNEISVLDKALINGENLDSIAETASHAEWAREVLLRYPEFSSENARAILEKEIGKVFLEVLSDAGVFKRNEEGRSAFNRFTDTL